MFMVIRQAFSSILIFYSLVCQDALRRDTLPLEIKTNLKGDAETEVRNEKKARLLDVRTASAYLYL